MADPNPAPGPGVPLLDRLEFMDMRAALLLCFPAWCQADAIPWVRRHEVLIAAAENGGARHRRYDLVRQRAEYFGRTDRRVLQAELYEPRINSTLQAAIRYVEGEATSAAASGPLLP